MRELYLRKVLTPALTASTLTTKLSNLMWYHTSPESADGAEFSTDESNEIIDLIHEAQMHLQKLLDSIALGVLEEYNRQTLRDETETVGKANGWSPDKVQEKLCSICQYRLSCSTILNT